MDKNKIAEFFNSCASSWDSNQETDEKIISIIFEKGAITKGASVLDVGSGTGILFPYYKKAGVSSLLGIDISEKMVELAKSKFPDTEIICGDAETYRFNCKFDAVMIYNAFPHFPCPDLLFENLSSALNEGGRLSVSHGAGREEIQKCHKGNAKPFSASLPEAKVLAEFMKKYLTVDTVISTDKMYMVSGVKNKTE